MTEPAAAQPFAGLRYLSWEITRRCDARCIHCYAESGPEVPVDGELPTARALALIDEIARGGQMVLALSGGEPLIRPDWRQLARHAVDRDLIVTLVTNGSRVDDDAADFLAALGLSSVTVSLDSHRPEVHDRIRALEGLHARALGAIRRLASRGVRVVVNFTPLRDTWRDARGVVEVAYQLGAAAVSLSEYSPSGRGTPELAISDEERRQLVETWLALAAEYQDRILLLADNRAVGLVSTGSADPCPDCGAGRTMASIDPEGELTPCGFSPYSFGSVRAVPFSELWHRTRGEREAVSGSGSCTTCSMLVAIGD